MQSEHRSNHLQLDVDTDWPFEGPRVRDSRKLKCWSDSLGKFVAAAAAHRHSSCCHKAAVAPLAGWFDHCVKLGWNKQRVCSPWHLKDHSSSLSV